MAGVFVGGMSWCGKESSDPWDDSCRLVHSVSKNAASLLFTSHL